MHANLPLFIRADNGVSLTDQIVQSLASRIDDKLLRAGARLPSIRRFAATHSVSAFTVVEAYDRLVARGYLESRRNAGFFVRERAALTQLAPVAVARPQQMDVAWLVRNMVRELPAHKMPGGGLLPPDWLDAGLVANGLRAIGRQGVELLLNYGAPQGFLPLREQLQILLAGHEIACPPQQIVTTSGVTQALDLIARQFLQPGDTVFVDDPSWFLMFGTFVSLGIRVVGITRQADGPDLAQLAELAALHKPKLFVINSVLHNPTSTSLSSAKAFQLLKLAEQFDFLLVEDDIYSDMHPGVHIQPAARLAALDQLSRVIYLGGFSKTVSANLRVGFIATSPERAQALADRKMLATLATTDIGERIIHKILTEGHYRKHVERLRGRLEDVRAKTVRQMERAGLAILASSPAGMFVWTDAGRDTARLAEQAFARGFLLAPGALFSPSQLPSTKMRMNVAAMRDPALWQFLAESCGGKLA
ncbi:MAG TPA: PLP-dependent aminotransferase family protein [Burkholderiaceae bacterium]